MSPIRTAPPASLRPLRSLAALAALAAVAFAQGPPPPPPPPQLGPVPVPPGNPITPAKAVLGKILFWEEQLSSDNTTACGTCHIPSAQGGDPRAGQPASRHAGFDSIFFTPDDVFGSPGVVRADADDNYVESATFGFSDQVTPRATPTMVGAAYAPLLFWDGRASSTFVDPVTGATVLQNGAALESQAVGPVTSDVEMAHADRDWAEVVAKLGQVDPLALATNLPPDVASALLASPDYPALFQAAFGSPQITPGRIGMAIATYERTLIPNQTDYDAFAAGNPAALTPQEQQGFQVFSTGGRCVACHTPPHFTNVNAPVPAQFRNIGVRPPDEDLGRQVETGIAGDRGRFKVPTLRNVALRSRFFHNGSQPNLAGVLAFYARHGDFNDNKDPVIDAIVLPPQAAANVQAFLTGGLTDPRVANELPPFDRPTLHSETPAADPPVVGRGIAGAGGIPQMIATAPPALGAPGFKLGLAGARGGAQAFLALLDPATGQPLVQTRPGYVLYGGLARFPIATLPGGGATDGFTTYHLELPDLAALVGQKLRAQWWVVDPTAPGGFAKSPQIELTLF